MKDCLFPSCMNTEQRTPEKSFFRETVGKRIPKRCGRQVKIDGDFSQNPLDCGDHFNSEKIMENSMKVEPINTKQVLNKDTARNCFLGLKQKDRVHQCQKIQEETAMESSTQVPLKDIRVHVNILKQPCGNYSAQEDRQLLPSYSCMLCQREFLSQNSLAAHFSNCIMHLEFAHASSTSGSGSGSNCTESNDLGKSKSNKMYDCKICSLKFSVKDACERHQAKCQYQHKLVKKDQKPETSSMKPELPIFYYCNICFVGFDEEHAWESHLAGCEYRPKVGKKDQNALTTSFTKEPFKDVLHEKVIEDEAWLVTSLPQGYECVDAMFVVEAEGTCMLQQQIPVEPEEELEVAEEQKEQEVLVADRGISPLEQDLLPAWPLSLLPGAFEAEGEKEMMEQKLVLEPRLIQSAFVCRREQPSEGFEEPTEEPPEGTLAITEVSDVGRPLNEAVEEDASLVADLINVKIEPEEFQIKVACH